MLETWVLIQKQIILWIYVCVTYVLVGVLVWGEFSLPATCGSLAILEKETMSQKKKLTMKKCPLLSSTYRRGEKKFPALCNESPDYSVRGQRADVRLHPLSFCLIVIPRTGTRPITAAQLSSEITVLCLGSPPLAPRLLPCYSDCSCQP